MNLILSSLLFYFVLLLLHFVLLFFVGNINEGAIVTTKQIEIKPVIKEKMMSVLVDVELIEDIRAIGRGKFAHGTKQIFYSMREEIKAAAEKVRKEQAKKKTA